MASITDYLASKLKSLSPEVWDGFVRWLDARFRALEEKADITDRVADSILARGLQVIEDGIGPSIIRAREAADTVAAIADLGMIFTAPSESTVLIGPDPKIFTIPENRRAQFSPAAIVMAYAGDTYENAIIGVTQSYDRTNGVLTLAVIDTKGSGVFSSWTITPIATTEDLEALRDNVEANALSAGQSATSANNAKLDSQALSRDFRQKYLGALPADPTIDGNGDPVTAGAIYTNTLSGKLRYRSPTGWQDTTAGSNILAYQFTTDDRGTAPYALPENPVSKANCFVILGGVPQMRTAYDVDGVNFSFTEDPGSGQVVEVTIVAQLGIGTPSNDTVGASQIKTGETEAIIAKLGLAGIFPRLDGGNAGGSGWGAIPPGTELEGQWKVVPPGFLDANGAAVSRTQYPALDTYMWVGDTDNATADCYYRCTNQANPNGSRSVTGGYLVLPDYRGEFRRGWDNGRGVDAGRKLGSWQASQNLAHSHTGTTTDAGSHSHTGSTTDAGSHSHTGSTTNAGAHTHDQTGSGSPGNALGAYYRIDLLPPLPQQPTTAAGDHNHGLNINAAGNHNHGLNVNASGNHNHSLNVNSSGGSEARPRNVAVRVIIKT